MFRIREKICVALILFAGGISAFGSAFAFAPQSGEPAQVTLRQACRADYQKFCSGIMPGGGRLLACLNAHGAQLSTDCHDALNAAGKLSQPPAQPKNRPDPEFSRV